MGIESGILAILDTGGVPIRSDADYQAALSQIDALFNAAPGTAEADRVEVLAVLVADYERRRHADAQPDPIDVLERQASTRVPELVAIRYGRMLGKLRIPSTPEPGTDLGRPPSLRR